MKQSMLNLQELSDITGKSPRTLRRVVKLSTQIQTEYIQSKLVANLNDVLVHY